MADYSTHSSCIFDVGTAANAKHAGAVRAELAVHLDRHEGVALGFEMEVDHETGPGARWIHNDEYGEPEDAVLFVLRCAEALDPQGIWGFTWRESCSKPRVDAFGGGGPRDSAVPKRLPRPTVREIWRRSRVLG